MLKPTFAIPLALVACSTSTLAAETSTAKFFHDKIATILVSHCLECHSTTKEGGLELTTKAGVLKGGESGRVIVPGDSDDSLLYEFVASPEMPPKKKLSDRQIADIKKWIDDGAFFPEKPLDPFAITTDTRAGFDWWSLQPLSNNPPAAEAKTLPAWRENEIDRFVASRLAERGLAPSPPASPRTLIRRATYDLLGLPPTPKEVADFLRACEQETSKKTQVGEKAYAALLDRLLASQHYGEQWGRHWLDVVRFGESNGYERNVIHTTVWPFRDYIIRSLNEDKPFNRLIQEHLAGDVLAPDDPSVAVGTAFLVCGPYDNVGNQDKVAAAQIRADMIDEMIRATGGGFLGLTVGCSRCHDHKFDPISQRDYYSLYATFAGVRHGERVLKTKQSEATKQQLIRLRQDLAKVDEQLQEFQPLAITGRTIVIDDETPASDNATLPSVELLATKRGHGVNPPGEARGQQRDQGDLDRSPNISGHRYLWWTNEPGKDIFTWNPAAAGKFRVWLSWGCGMPSHSSDAEYLLDVDGDLSTRDDQTTIASVDQRYFAGGGPESIAKQALWSGFLNAGVHELGNNSRIVLRGGKTGSAITADVIVLQEESIGSPERSESQTQPSLRLPVDARLNHEYFAPTKAKYIRFTIKATNQSEPCIDELEVFTVATNSAPARNVGLRAKPTSSGDYAGNPKHRLSHINDGKYGNSFSWISNQQGGGWVQLELPETVEIDHIVWGRDREQKYADRLATKYEITVAVEPGKWKVVASSRDRLTSELLKSTPVAPRLQLTSTQTAFARPLLERRKTILAKQDELRQQTSPPKWWVGNFSQVNGPFQTFLGGDPQRRGDDVQPASMQTLSGATKGYGLPVNAPEAERRLALANWIVADDNPLTPRVLANRVWHYHFGTGIVNTPSDFGFAGGKPSHPQLLDWLARFLREHDWRLKPLHKQIMLSQTYRQASEFRADAASVDGDARLLWRFPPRRLEGEEIRDTTLAIAGKLDTRMGGPGFRLFRYVQDNVATYHPLDVHGPDTYRRAVYHHRARAMQIDLLTEFDAPDCAISAPRRSSTTTPLQALTLLNHSFTVDMANALADRLTMSGDNVTDQIELAFELAFSRPPNAEERQQAESLVTTHGLRALCRALLNANEFIYLN